MPEPTDGVTSLAISKQELDELLTRKSMVEAEIAAIERQIYELEGSYLEDTNVNGNIVRGFEGYLNRNTIPAAEKRRQRLKESDRIFSLSSNTYQQSLGIPIVETSASLGPIGRTVEYGQATAVIDPNANVVKSPVSHKKKRVRIEEAPYSPSPSTPGASTPTVSSTGRVIKKGRPRNQPDFEDYLEV